MDTECLSKANLGWFVGMANGSEVYCLLHHGNGLDIDNVRMVAETLKVMK